MPAGERRAASGQAQIAQHPRPTRTPPATPASHQEMQSANSLSGVAGRSANGFPQSKAGWQSPSALQTPAPRADSPHSRTQSAAPIPLPQALPPLSQTRPSAPPAVPAMSSYESPAWSSARDTAGQLVPQSLPSLRVLLRSTRQRAY